MVGELKGKLISKSKIKQWLRKKGFTIIFKHYKTHTDNRE